MDPPSMSSLFKRQKETKWRIWLHQYVYADIRDTNTIMKRYQCFQYFIKEGLAPFAKSHGYTITLHRNLENDLANYLYNDCKYDFLSQDFRRYYSNRDKIDIDYDYYVLKGIPEDDWILFWKSWEHMSDFTGRNYRNKYMIPIFLYNRLNLEVSETTEKITRELEEEEDQDDYNGPIVEQASEAIGQGKDRNSLY